MHKHRKGVTLGYFLETVGMKFNNNCLILDDKTEYCNNDKNELIGINKNVSSKINMIIDDKSKIETITFFNQVDGDIYPEKDLPENARKLRGFIWREDERIKSKDDIFPPEENELDAKIQASKKAEMLEEDAPMKPSKETLDYDKNNPKTKSDSNKAGSTPMVK